MSQKTDPDLISIQFRVAGKRVLLRNAMIGAAIVANLATAMVHYLPLQGLLEPAVGGLVIGLIGGVAAWLGQIAARPEPTGREFHQPIHWKAVIYSGLITWWIALILIVFGELTSYYGDAGLGLLYTLMAVVLGAVLSAGMTIGVASVMRVLRSSKSQQMLGEGGFDPLRNIENREHARR